eukprot:9724405-Prorocentrum_lima.AAC.1
MQCHDETSNWANLVKITSQIKDGRTLHHFCWWNSTFRGFGRFTRGTWGPSQRCRGRRRKPAPS